MAGQPKKMAAERCAYFFWAPLYMQYMHTYAYIRNNFPINLGLSSEFVDQYDAKELESVCEKDG
jgi:hypothetical protein